MVLFSVKCGKMFGLTKAANFLSALTENYFVKGKATMADLELTKNYEYRLRVNKKFIARASEVLEESRQLFNAALAHRKNAYEAEKKSVTIYDQQFELTELRKEYPDYAKTSRGIQREALDRIDKAFKNFFRRVKVAKEKAGFPRFKNRDRYDSFAYPVDARHNSPLQGDKLNVPSVGTVRVRLHRELPENSLIKQVRIIRKSDGWYAVLTIKYSIVKPVRVNDGVVGLDVGITSFLTLSNGEQVKNPRYAQAGQSLLTKRSQSLALKTNKRSNRRKKVKALVAKAYLKVTRQRKHFHEKVVNDLVSRFGVICVEDLKIKNMVRSNLARVISDVAWGNFIQKLILKAEEAAGLVIKVNPKFTSQTCPQCGCIDALNRLTQAEFCCIKCGYENHADIVGAINILARGEDALHTRSVNTAVRKVEMSDAPSGLNDSLYAVA
jgi:putative transposase